MMRKELDDYRAEADRLRAAEAKLAAEMSHIVKAVEILKLKSSKILFASTSTALVGYMFFHGTLLSWHVQTHFSFFHCQCIPNKFL